MTSDSDSNSIDEIFSFIPPHPVACEDISRQSTAVSHYK
jgi:hypothetical protein